MLLAASRNGRDWEYGAAEGPKAERAWRMPRILAKGSSGNGAIEARIATLVMMMRLKIRILAAKFKKIIANRRSVRMPSRRAQGRASRYWVGQQFLH